MIDKDLCKDSDTVGSAITCAINPGVNCGSEQETLEEINR
jgi:hypothetical protein